ncbi:hypothetical protein Aspvir_007311 [Aspergillus viridinutans]|uniref:Uncharacterized protein n=1 Tax=Aspergillus viridinutans TaxID=75553 RepID=A0A9P3C0H9_ASPVI|nr:uncharacterized protein Aspvir_007311 [Aspergillus viridinutans]GIK03242.1 hypothetical protein Aspvir_007311 [Aspergillus viridinutans]
MDSEAMDASAQHNGTIASNFSSNRTEMSRLITDYLDYKGYESFVASIEDSLNTSCDFIQFSNVSAKDFEFLASDKNRTLKSARFSYNFVTECLTIKMPQWDHKELAGLFRAMIDEQLFSMLVSGEFISLSSPLTVLGSWAKEPDAAWSPESTGNLTVVLEVGDSESAQQLAINARGWLESPGTTAETCITIDLSEENNLTIDVWRLDRRVYAVSTRRLPSPAVRVQHVKILNGDAGPQIDGWKMDENMGEIPTDEIQLDFAMFVGRRATTSIEQDIVISRDLLMAFANRFWRRQGRRSARS